MNTPLTIPQVVEETVKNVAVLSAVVAPAVYGVGEIIKKIKIKGKSIPGWVIGVLASPIGILVTFFIQGFQFTGIGIVSGFLAGFAASATYSTIKSASTTK